MENRLRVNPGNGLECRKERRQKQQRHRGSAHELPEPIQCSQLLSHLYLSPFQIEIFIANETKETKKPSMNSLIVKSERKAWAFGQKHTRTDVVIRSHAHQRCSQKNASAQGRDA